MEFCHRTHSWLAGLVLAGVVVAAAPASAQPVRLSAMAFGEETEIEVRDLNKVAARAAIQAAFHEMAAIDRLFDLSTALPTGVAALNAAAGKGPQPADRRVGDALFRAQSFCLWSNGAFGPLGGTLYGHLAGGAAASDLRAGIESASCGLVRVNLGEPQPAPLDQGGGVDPGGVDAGGADGDVLVELAPGSVIDLRGWARGYAIDRAVEILRLHGAGNAWIESGAVRRGIGPGPDGQGWLVVLAFPGIATPVDRLWLRDQALAVSLPLAAIRQGDVRFVNQRNGRPASGIVAVVTVSELAIDAEALAASLAILGLREGRMRVASLKPAPAALWLLGEGRGQPLRAEYHWAELPRIRKH